MKTENKGFANVELTIAILLAGVGLLVAINAIHIVHLRNEVASIKAAVSPDRRSLTYEERLETCRMNILSFETAVKAFQDTSRGNYPGIEELKRIIQGHTCPVDGLSYEDMLMAGPLGGDYLDKTQHRH